MKLVYMLILRLSKGQENVFIFLFFQLMIIIQSCDFIAYDHAHKGACSQCLRKGDIDSIQKEKQPCTCRQAIQDKH